MVFVEIIRVEARGSIADVAQKVEYRRKQGQYKPLFLSF